MRRVLIAVWALTLTAVVAVTPSLYRIPDNKVVVEGAAVTFICNATGNPTPNITWLKDDKTMGRGKNLTFVANRNSSGEYWCIADSGSNATGNVSAKLNVLFPPRFTIVPSDQMVVEKDQVTFACSATGNPVPNITWIKDGKTVQEGDVLSFEATRNHSGIYQCLADNGVEKSIETNFSFLVQFGPDLVETPSDQTVTEGNQITFQCRGVGNPAPEINWIKDGEHMGEGETLTVVALRNDSGVYWCVAENDLGDTANASASLDVQFGPDLVETPSDQTVTEGNQITFQCRGVGNPAPEINWIKDGEHMGEGETLTVVALRNDSGVYWCVAENDLGDTANASASLDVQFGPDLVETPSDQTVTEGNQITFECRGVGNPAPEINWIKDGEHMGEGETLTVVALRNDSGVYWCVAENDFSDTANASASLDVQFAPSFTIVPSDQTVMEEDQVMFNCSATGNPVPNISWIKDGKTVGEGDVFSFEATRGHSGIYRCLADNGIEENIEISFSFNVQYLPTLDSKPSNQTVMEGDKATLHCNATGNPAPSVRWIKNGKTVGNEDLLSFVTKRNDSGKYWCLAENGLSSFVTAMAYLDVQFGPELVETPYDQTITEGNQITFQCQGVGNPAPEINWIKDGEHMGEGETLTVDGLRNDSGEYWCVAGNGLGDTANASASLDVQFAPSFTIVPSDQTVMEEDQVNFTCSATGNPVPNITWIKDGKTVSEGDVFSFEATRGHSGNYRCLADNGIEENIEISFSFNVQFGPELVETPSDQTITEGNQITFQCQGVGNPAPEINWIKDGEHMGEGETLTVDGLRNDSGEYWCVAGNGLGDTANARASLDVQFAPSFTIVPCDQTVMEEDQVMFNCSATGNPVPNITWIKDGKTVGEGDVFSFEATRGHSGNYRCLADNGIEENIEISFSFNVQYLRTLDWKPSNQTVMEGAKATLHCNATGNPAPSVRWIKDGKTVGNEDLLSFVTKRNDSGKYWCLAENGLSSTVTAIAYLDVQYPSSFTSKPIDKTVKEGVDINFHCAVNGKPTPNVTWIKDGKIIGSGDMLTITAYKNQSGKYWCSAYNGLGERVNASANLNVQFKPKQTNLSVNVDVLKPVPFGASIEFSCTTHSHPHAQEFKFYRDEKLLVSNSTGIYNLRLERSGLYSCVPFNSAGEGKRATLRINVNAWQPSFENLLFGPFYLFKGIQARLPCKPSAEPSPTIKWLKDGVALRYVENGSYSLNSDGTLVINKVDDSDSGRYTCVAENYFGKANVTASGILLERTKLVRKPQNGTVAEGSSLKLPCMASKDPNLELRYIWKKDGAVIMDASNSEWQEKGFVLTLSNIGFQDAGVYTCVAHTPEPRVSEDMASAVVSIEGAPFPPTNVQITDCSSNRTNISWTPNLSNRTQETHYLIEQETNHEPFSFKVIYNVTNPNSTSLTLELPAWSTLRFRVRAVSNVKLSRPSEATAEGICITPVGVPQMYPMNLRGTAKKANELSITWTPMPKTKWNAPGCYYMLKYRQKNLRGDWRTEKIGDPDVDVFSVSDPGYYQPWEFKICAGNHQGLGPESPISWSFSGQNAPDVKPDGAGTQSVNATSVALAWKPVTLNRGSVDGYKIYYWVNSRSVISRRRREAIPTNANFLVVQGGETRKATLLGLKPYTNYRVVVKAFNTGGEGPASAPVLVTTSEGEPGPPSDLKTYAFGEYILVTWKQPKVPNGIITNYQVKCQEYNGSVVKVANVTPSVFKELLGDLAFEKSYELEVTAKTSKGWGESARTVAKTVKRSVPAKPKVPEVVESGEGAVTVTYNFDVGGGWTSEFKVLYRKKGEGGEFQETDWVDYFSTETVEITGLESKSYEFKTVGRNAVGTSTESDIVELKPEAASVVGRPVDSPSVYNSDWFITLMVISAGTLVLLAIIFIYRRCRRRSRANFKVSEHENEPEKQYIEPGSISTEIKRREDWKKSLQNRLEVESQDSLDEYGGNTPYFTEEGSFVGDLTKGSNRRSIYDEISSPAV
ncbi:neuroglian-like isoform X2 [Montipora foliosa]|uniref:neuroglian-like isoform X2 n=1 Tax=Montipora foliosa TaxID=591990 RepID=UPI0035F113B6